MKELALHILDIAENGIQAGATCIHIQVHEARSDNLLRIVVQDNGHGIAPENIPRLTDPFVTSRTSRRVGLGLPLLEDAARRCDGRLTIESETKKGTTVTAWFRYDHIDRAPLGDLAATVAALVAGHPEIDFVYSHTIDGQSFQHDTRQLRNTISGAPETSIGLARMMSRSIHRSLEGLNRRTE